MQSQFEIAKDEEAPLLQTLSSTFLVTTKKPEVGSADRTRSDLRMNKSQK